MQLVSDAILERNQEFHGDTRRPAHVVAEGVRKFIEEYNNANRKEMLAMPPRLPRWEPLGNGLLKVNFDGAFDRSSDVGGIEVVIRKSSGEVMATKAKFYHEADSFIIEGLAARQAIEFAAEMGF
ncbi:hypothetical protein PTKIN_Ptkin06aG0074500 [Pterospermum kingtungense]